MVIAEQSLVFLAWRDRELRRNYGDSRVPGPRERTDVHARNLAVDRIRRLHGRAGDARARHVRDAVQELPHADVSHGAHVRILVGPQAAFRALPVHLGQDAEERAWESAT